MIQSFRHKRLEGFFYDGTKKGLQPRHVDKVAAILDVLDAATTLQDINFPGSGLHKLEPKTENRYAVSVSGNWRITFRFDGGDVFEVDYEDYH